VTEIAFKYVTKWWIKKAFDCVNNQLLLKKLSYVGIRGIANNQIDSYLSDRYQKVKTNNIKVNLC